MSDNNISTSTSTNEELEKPIPPVNNNPCHGHGHNIVPQSRNLAGNVELIDKLAAETKPLPSLPLPRALSGHPVLSTATTASSCLKVENENENPNGSGNQPNTTTPMGMNSAKNKNNGNIGQVRKTASTSSAATMTTEEVIRKIDLEILPSIGESFQLQQVNFNENVTNLKKIIINKLKLQNREQITLLYREKVLLMGLISDYGICHGSRITLLPSIETGLLTQRPEQSVLEALEGLNETQINDFLSGKSPLNLTMRLGEHVMLIQLQLSKGQALAAAAAAASHKQSHHHHASSSSSSGGPTSSSSSTTKTTLLSTSASSILQNQPSSSNSKSEESSPTLAEASRNLTKTLKRISSKVNKVTTIGSSLSTHNKHHRNSGTANSSGKEIKGDEEEIINLKHHGKGVYSGTFSGTLNPALQDSYGKPRKHVSTIVHILNDLLGTIDLRSGDSTGEIGLKSSSVGTSNTLKRKKTTVGSVGSSVNSAGQLLADTLVSECTDSEESHDNLSTKPVVALKLQKMSNTDGNELNPMPTTSTSTKNDSSQVGISKDEENRLLRLKIEKLKENLLARKLKLNT